MLRLHVWFETLPPLYQVLLRWTLYVGSVLTAGAAVYFFS